MRKYELDKTKGRGTKQCYQNRNVRDRSGRILVKEDEGSQKICGTVLAKLVDKISYARTFDGNKEKLKQLVKKKIKGDGENSER